MSSRHGVMNVATKVCLMTDIVSKCAAGVGLCTSYIRRVWKILHGISKTPHERLRQHRAGVSGWTQRAADWNLVYLETVDEEGLARCQERAIKRRGAKRFLSDLEAPRL